MRHTIPVLVLEFEEGGNTIWVQGLGGTVLRLKTDGKVTSVECQESPVSHVDVMVKGDISVCVATGIEKQITDEYLDKVSEVVDAMILRALERRQHGSRT